LTDWKFIYHKQVTDRIRGRYAEAEVMKAAKQGGKVFVDVGANLGEYTKRVWRNYRTIIAFEPNHHAFEKLRLSFGWRSLFCNLVPVECAVSDENGEIFLNLNQDKIRCNGSADTIENVFNYRPVSMPDVSRTWRFDPSDRRPKRVVEMRRLDTILRTLKVIPGHISLVKIDVEGSEFRVLEGAAVTLGYWAERVIVELHDRERKKELEKQVEDYGFQYSWIDPDHIYGVKT
jgi:FkbM family methyltransferase